MSMRPLNISHFVIYPLLRPYFAEVFLIKRHYQRLFSKDAFPLLIAPHYSSASKYCNTGIKKYFSLFRNGSSACGDILSASRSAASRRRAATGKFFVPKNQESGMISFG